MSQSFNKHYQRFQLPVMSQHSKSKSRNNKLINETADIYLQSHSKNRYQVNHAPLRNRNNYETLKTINRKSIQVQVPTKNITIQPNNNTGSQQRTYYKRQLQNTRKNYNSRRYEDEDIRGSSKSPYLKAGNSGRHSSLNRSAHKIKSSNFVKLSNNGPQLYKQPRSSLSQHYEHYETSLHKRRVSVANNSGQTNHGQQRNYILEEAKEYYKNNHYEKAVELLKKYIKYNPSCVEAHYFIGMSLINDNQISVGIRELEETLILEPKYKKSLYLVIALAYKRLNKIDDAIDILSKGLEAFPDHYDCLVYRGKMYLKQHSPSLALLDFDKAIKFNEKKGFAYIGKGTSLKQLGKVDEAIKAFSKGLDTDMKQACLEKRALCFYDHKKYDLALRDFESCQSTNFSHSYIMGLCYYHLNKPIEAILCFEETLKNDTSQENVTNSVEMMMRIKIEDKDFYEAYHILNRTVSFQINKNVIQQWRIFLEGVLFMMKKKYMEGIQMFNKFLQLDSYSIEYEEIGDKKKKQTYAFLKPLVYLYKAFGELSESNIQNAKNDYKQYQYLAKVLKFREQNLSKVYNCLIIESKEIFPKNCLPLLQKAAALIPNKPQPYLFLAFECVQNSLCEDTDKKQENIELIIQNLTKAINNLPQLSNNHISSFFYYRAIIYLYKGDFNKSVADIDKAIEKSQDNIPKYFYLRGLIFAVFGNFAQAVQDLSVAISLDEKEPRPYLERAKCLQIEGNSNDAFLDLQKYITLSPQDPYIHKYAGFLLFQNCAYQDCLSAFSHGNESNTDHQMLLTKAKCYFLLNNSEQSLELFKQYEEETCTCQYKNDIMLIKVCDRINLMDGKQIDQIPKVQKILDSITNEEEQCKIFKLRDMHQILASIYLLNSEFEAARKHLQKTLYYFRQEKNREKEKQFIQDQQEFQDQWSEVEIKYNIAIIDLCEQKYSDAWSIFKEFENSPEKGKNWTEGFNLINKLKKSEGPLPKIELDVFEQNHRISKNWPKIKLQNQEVYLSLAFSYPFVEPPEMLPEFNEALFDDFNMKKVENKPEAPWINRQQKGLVFTPNIQVFQNLELSVTTKKNNDEDDESQPNKPISDIEHSVQLSNSDFQMQAQALKQKFKLDSLVEMRLKKLMKKKDDVEEV